MKNVNKASASHEDALIASLKADPAFAAEYLRAALEDEDDSAVLLTVLRQIARAYGVQKVAEESGLNRESLYRSLSAKGNPRLKTLRAVLKPLGLRLTVTAA